MENYFNQLYNVDMSSKIAKKNGLNYLSWAAVWAEVKKLHPNADYYVYENAQSRPWFDDGRTAWVKTTVTINEISHTEILPIMDFKNKSIPSDTITSMEANKAIQRCLTKACGRHGLGLRVYEGEDVVQTAKDNKDKQLKEVKNEIISLAKTLIAAGVDKTKIYDVVKQYTGGSTNPNTITTVEDCESVLETLHTFETKKED